MGGIFGQVVTAFQGLLSRGFWFGSFLPVTVFATLNALLCRTLTPGADDLLTQLAAGDKWNWTAPIVAALIVIAYALAPLVPLWRAFLDGRLLPEWLYARLRRYPEKSKKRAYDAAMASTRMLSAANLLRNSAESELASARAAGIALGGMVHPELIESAVTAVQRLEGIHSRGKVPSIEALQAAVNAVAEALRRNDTTSVPNLEGIDSRMRDVIGSVSEEARTKNARQMERYNSMPEEMRPTAIGNARYLSEFYARNVYHASFDFIWSRVQMVIPENDPAVKRIEAARALLDFAVLSLMLGIILIAVWLPLLAFYGTTLLPFLLLGLIGPAVVRLTYQLVIEAQTGLGEVAQGAVDRFRFDVLKTLHIKPPATLSAEREIWSTLSAIAHGEAPNTDMVWTNPP